MKRHLGALLLLVTLGLVRGPAAVWAQSDPVADCQRGLDLYAEGNVEAASQALERYFAARDEARFQDPESFAICALYTGLVRDADAEWEGAKAAYLVALEQFERSGPGFSDFLGKTLQYLSKVSSHLDNPQDVVRYAEASLPYLEEAGLADDVLQSRINLAVAHYQLKDYPAALAAYEAVLTELNTDDEPYLRTVILNNIGSVYEDMGQPEEAVVYRQQAVALAQQAGLTELEAMVQSSLGRNYQQSGRLQEALGTQRAARQLWRQLDERTAEAEILINIGEVLLDLGEYREARESFDLAQSMLPAEYTDIQAQILNDIGEVLRLQGHLEEALVYYEDALSHYGDSGSPVGRAVVFTNMGAIYREVGASDEALQMFSQARVLFESQSETWYTAATQVNIGDIHRRAGRLEEAEVEFRSALASYEQTGSRLGQARVLSNLGYLASTRGDSQGALDYFYQSAQLAEGVGDRVMEAIVRSELSHLLADEDRVEEARTELERALTLLAEVRARAGDDLARATFVGQHANVYDQGVAFYLQQGQIEAAFDVSEQGRARAFLDSLATGEVTLSDEADKALLEAERAAYEAVEAARLEFTSAQSAVQPALEQVARLEQQLDEARAQHRQILAEIESQGDAWQQLVPGLSQTPALQTIQNALDETTTLVAYWVLEEETVAFILNRDRLEFVRLATTRADVKQLVESYGSFLDSESSNPASSSRLYQLLVTPLLNRLHTEKLIIVPHRALHYLSFAALQDGGAYLGDSFVISYLPSAASLVYLQEQSQGSSGQPLILGDPATGTQALSRLPFAAGEAQTVARFLNSPALLGVDASEKVVHDRSAGARLLHLAAHATLNHHNPLYSYVALAPGGGEDGRLEVHEVYGLDLDASELVVLSACNTNLGGLGNGDDLIGLTRAFLIAGTPRVIATLWQVEDAASGELMQAFYQFLQDGLGEAQALQKAQQALRQKYPSPYYWAGYVLVGDGGSLLATAPSAPTPPEVHPVTVAGAEVAERDEATPGWSLTVPLALLALLALLLLALVYRRRG